MKILVRAIVVLCIIILPIMLYVILIRMSAGKFSYIHINDVLTKLSELDWYDPIDRLLSIFNKAIPENWDNIGASFSQVNDIGSFFNAIGSVFTFLGFVLSTPFLILVGIIRCVIEWVGNLVYFIQFIVNY